MRRISWRYVFSVRLSDSLPTNASVRTKLMMSEDAVWPIPHFSCCHFVVTNTVQICSTLWSDVKSDRDFRGHMHSRRRIETNSDRCANSNNCCCEVVTISSSMRVWQRSRWAEKIKITPFCWERSKKTPSVVLRNNEELANQLADLCVSARGLWPDSCVVKTCCGWMIRPELSGLFSQDI